MLEVCGAELVFFGSVQYKYTPLHMAAMDGHIESVQLLLIVKSNINAENTVSDSLLQI
jgi:ankyrin repeat protein